MFYGCTKLESLNLGNLDTINVERMDYMFYNCSSLNNLNIYNFKTDYATDLKFMFYSCEKLEILQIPYFNTLECIEQNLIGLFDECYKISIQINVNKCQNLIKMLPDYINYTDISLIEKGNKINLLI